MNSVNDQPETRLMLYTEALVYASAESISINEIRLLTEQALNLSVTEDEVIMVLAAIGQKYAADDFAIGLVHINGGYQFLTKKEYHPLISLLQVHRSKKKLSQAALETLAIIAYRQPVTKLEIEQVRGVNSDYSVQKLLEKELITIAGKAKTVGNPVLYSTSISFMDYFGINSVAELPRFEEIVTGEAPADNVL